MDFDELDEAVDARVAEAFNVPSSGLVAGSREYGDQPLLQVGVLSTANIVGAGIIGPTMKCPDAAVISAIASREPAQAKTYKAEGGDALKSADIYDSYQDLLDRSNVDCVYIPLPNGLHYEWTMKALKAGKHVLCEKPLAANAEEARAMVELATSKGLVLMEAQHWFYHPVRHRLMDILKSGVLGIIQEIHFKFNLKMGLSRRVLEVKGSFDPKYFGGKMWIMKTSMAGGLTMTLGTYCIHVVRNLIGEQPIVTSAEPECLADDPEMDCTMKKAELFFPKSGVKGILEWSGMGPEPFHNELLIKGSEGNLATSGLMNNMFPNKITVTKPDGKELLNETIGSGGFTTYDLQLLAFVDHVHGVKLGRKNAIEFVNTGEDLVQQMEVIDQIYDVAGMTPRCGPSGITSKVEN